MKVSIVVPYYNSGSQILNLISSILNLNYPEEDYELILVDDGSTDNSCALAQKTVLEAVSKGYNIKTIRIERNSGPAVARNRGIKSSSGEIIAFTDSDCIIDRDWIRCITHSFENKKTGGAYGRIITSNKNQNMYPLETSPSDHKYVTANAAYLRKVMEAAGYFNEEFRVPFREDSELAYRILEKGFCISYDPEAIVYHPLKELSFKKLVSTSLWHQYDVLLYKLHPELSKDDLGHIYRPYIYGISPLFSLPVLLAALIFYPFQVTALLLIILIACLIAFSIINRKAGKKIFLMVAYIVTYTSLMFVSRLYGSIKFRKVLI